jgi:hypothetical protein
LRKPKPQRVVKLMREEDEEYPSTRRTGPSIVRHLQNKFKNRYVYIMNSLHMQASDSFYDVEFTGSHPDRVAGNLA